MRAGRLAVPIAVATSALVHLGIAALSTSPPRPPLLETGLTRALAPALGRASAIGDRVRLLAGARRALAAGELRLGEFLIRAAALDARERGESFDEARARELYRARVRRLERALDAGVPLTSAVPQVFGDLHYDLTEGRLPRALLGGGGNCEALSHLIAAAVHDAGRAGWVELRYWGGASLGRPAHLAPVVGARDLVAGTPTERGGRSFRAIELVERYAALHGGGEAGDEAGPFAAYPDNPDVFPGATPLYAEQAVAVAGAGGGAVALGSPPAPARCWASLHDLVVPQVDALVGARPAALTLDLHQVPTSGELAADGSELGQFEQTLATTAGAEQRLLQLACLAIVYDRAMVRFAARSKTALANAISLRRRRALDEAARLGRELIRPSAPAALGRLDGGSEAWMLVVVPQLEDALFEHAFETQKGRPTTLLVALVSYRPTAERALAAVDRLPKTTQLVLALALFFPTFTGYRESLLGARGNTELARVARAVAALDDDASHQTFARVRGAIVSARVDPSWLAAWDELGVGQRAP